MKKLLLYICVLLLFGCKTKERIVTVEHTRTDTLYQVRELRDSVFVKDSVFVNQYTKGDTVFLTRDRWKVEYRDVCRTDTVLQSSVDSVAVPVPYPVEVEVEKKLSWWQKLFMGFGEIALALGLAILGLKIYRLVRS